MVGVAAFLSVRRLSEDTSWVEHTREVMGRLEALSSSAADAQNSRRGYVVTGDASYLESLPDAIEGVAEERRQIRGLLKDNAAQLQRLDALERLIEAQANFGQRVTEARRTQGFEAARELTLTREGERLRQEIRSAVEAMQKIEEDLLVQRQARTRASVRTTKIVIVGGSGLAVGFLGLALIALKRDFSGRRRAEDLLRQSEESLSVTLHSMGDGVLATDTSGKITRMNGVAERLTGWTMTEALGRPIAEVFHIIHEGTRAPAIIPVDDVLASGEVKALANHTVLIARDGREIDIADSAAPIRDRRERMIGVVLVFRDVSEERAAEIRLAEARRELERFFTLSIDFLCISSSDGFFKRVSPAVTDMLGWSVEEFLVQPFMDMVHPDDRDATLREVEKQMTTGEKVLQFENRYRHKDGTWRRLSWRSVPQPGGLMYATARDVTARHQAEAEIRRLNSDLRLRADQIEASNRELEAFSYSVSHDLRAPLRHVQGYVGMLLRDHEDRLSEEGKRYLSTIADAGRKMGQLIDDLLSFSRMGRSEMREMTVDLNVLIEETRRELQPVTRDRKIVWKVAVLPKGRGDAAMLKQVLVNLVGNAVKYTRLRDPAEIEIGYTEEQGGRMIVFVRDNGAGFDMKYVGKLFAVFQRLHRAEEFEGTGIGLANVQRIIARHGGKVWAEGAVDRGATFYFTLQRA